MRQLKTFTLKLKGDTDYPGLIEIKAENLIDIADLDVDVAKAKLEVLCRSKAFNGVIDAVLFSRFEPAAKQVMIHITGRPVVFSVLTAKDRAVVGMRAVLRFLTSRVFRRMVVAVCLSILLVFAAIFAVHKYNRMIRYEANSILFSCLVDENVLTQKDIQNRSRYNQYSEVELFIKIDDLEKDSNYIFSPNQRISNAISRCRNKSGAFYRSRSLFD